MLPGGGRSRKRGVPQALHGRGRTGLVPWGPARRQEQGSRWAGPPAAVGLAAGC